MPNINQNIQGGEAGETEQFFGSPFFHEGVNSVRLTSKKTFGMRILPAFDRSIPVDDPRFLQSFIPYRDANIVDPATQDAQFTSWYYSVKGYNFFGRDRSLEFLSPLTGHTNIQRGVDPLYDIYLTAKNSGESEYKLLAEKPKSKGQYAVLNPFKRFFVFNALVNLRGAETDGEMVNRLVVGAGKALELFKGLLGTLRPASEAVVTPEWSNYLFGDITDPMTGLWAKSKEVGFGDAGMTTVGLFFSSDPKRLHGASYYEIDPNSDYGRGVLAARYDIGDVARVTKIPTAQEVLDIVVSDGIIPYALIQDACGKSWDIPPENRRPVYSGPLSQEDESAVDPNEHFSPQPVQPAPARTATPSNGAAHRPEAASAGPARAVAPVSAGPARMAPQSVLAGPARAVAPAAHASGHVRAVAPATAGIARPPVQPIRPAAAGPARAAATSAGPARATAPAARIVAPPAPVAAAPASDLAPAGEAPVWTQEYAEEFAQLDHKMNTNVQSMTVAEMERYNTLNQYRIDCEQRQPAAQ